jgi:solute carrier family 25 iron transporter 28/37
VQTAQKLIAEEGPLRLFRGVSTMLGASLPAHALYFSVFEAAKRLFGADSSDHTPIASGVSGVVATVCHDMIMTPMDVVKQRLQLGYYSGVMDCFKTVRFFLQSIIY